MNANDILVAALKIRNDLADRFSEHADVLNGTRIEVSGRMTNCAGKAYCRRDGNNTVKLSLAFFADETNFENHFFETVSHELAHVLAPSWHEFGRRREPHGEAWQAMHRKLGGNAERCHSMKLADGFAARRRASKHGATCSVCGQTVLLGPSQIKRHNQCIALGWPGYRHKTCPAR